ncbi:MAG: carboxypeptidase-like regulatory domain-containing protein, partial [Actinomycetota bacterium]|nr:carboxypeptidase-like regulatory domain-containing protein [Actinomycetota bacterium]
MVDTTGGTACLEVHEAGDDGPDEIWLCVPRPGLPAIAASQGYNWFRYGLGSDGTSVVPLGGPQQVCPPYPPLPMSDAEEPMPLLSNDGDWAHHGRYLIRQVLFAGADPPHWSPILVLTDEPQPFIGAIHARMQDPSSQGAAQSLLDEARPGRAVKLTQRVMNNWQPVVLRGVAIRSSFTEHDFALDHAVGYIQRAKGEPGRVLPNGHLWEGDVTDPDWPGLDWHIDVRPDADVRYLASAAEADRIAVEIEHFTLPVAYRPQLGEWLQVTGRWVIDCGHVAAGMTAADGFLTEIHPPELLVASRPDVSRPYSTLARVLVTGAWQGFPLSFVVYPPPRPSADAGLRWEVADEWCLNATLRITPWPENANHLICTLETDDPTPLLIHYNGTVGMTDTRGYHALITCWWEAPTAQVKGRLTHGTEPAGGSVVFYRSAGGERTPWRETAADEAGAYTIPALVPGKYWLRPAGPAWDFADVPRLVEVAAGAQELSFAASRA